MNRRLDLTERYRDVVESLLRQHLPGVEVWAYGSRVKGRSHPGSDLDLVLRNSDSHPLTATEMREIAEVFRESNVPFLVDISDWAALPERFRSEIEQSHIVLIGPTR